MSTDINDPAYPKAFDPFGRRPRPNPPWRPMIEFDPSKPAILHDELNNLEYEWPGAGDRRYEHWRKYATWHTKSVMTWCGYLIDRWREPVKH
jgi:hypothetical protein